VAENAKVALNHNDEYRTYAITEAGALLGETPLLLASRPKVNIEFAGI
jgi:hypothetical protein